MLGLAPGTVRAARPAVELALRPAGLPPGSLASGAPLPRLPAAPLAGFSLGPLRVVSLAVDSMAAGPSRQRRVSRDRRPARGPSRGRTRSRVLAGRSRRVACEPSPPAPIATEPSRTRRARQRRRVYQSGKGRATNRGGPGGGQAHRWPVGSARDRPRPEPRQRPGPASGLVLLGDPPSFDEDDTDPHCCVKPLDAVALPSRAATAACRTRQGPAASCSAPMASRLRCLSTVRPGMPPWPPRLPQAPRQFRLRCGTPSPSPRAPRTFQRSREAAACRI